MKLNLKALVLPSVVFCATAAFAANQARVDVPFSFTAKGTAYPAGRYDVIADSNQSLVTLVSHQDATKHISWLMLPAEPARFPTVVTFDQAGSAYTLKTVQMGNRITPNLDSQPKAGISASTSIGGQ